MFRHPSEKVEHLKKVPLFRDLNKRQLDEVAKLVDETDSKPGEVLVREGELGRELVIIVDGSARVEHAGKIIGHIGPGEFFGEMALLDGQPRSATVITDTQSSILLIHSRSFLALLDTVPGLERCMLITLVQRLRERDKAMVS